MFDPICCVKSADQSSNGNAIAWISHTDPPCQLRCRPHSSFLMVFLGRKIVQLSLNSTKLYLLHLLSASLTLPRQPVPKNDGFHPTMLICLAASA